MATNAQIQATIESFWTNHQAKFIGVQDDYAVTHSRRYWQGIVSSSIPPDDGALVNPDLTRKPTDQAERWLDVFIGGRSLPSANWPASIRVDVYDGPGGTGWSVTVTYTKAGQTWSRTFHIAGPETWRESPWAFFS